ncbi:MAG: energy transducer TonB [Bacteroidales bacterium]|nr:energy transducer TonB [Bacteroidales bacterium]
MNFKDKETQRKLIGIGVSIAVHGLAIALLLILGLRYPDPPPPELGVEMDLGEFSDIGTDTEHAAEGGEDVSLGETIPDEEVGEVTQDTEDVPLVSKKTENKQKKSKQEPVAKPKENKEPEINQNALFKGGRVKKGSGGDAGEGKGDGKGSGGDGAGSGTSFSLAGRGAKSLGKPSSTSKETGSVVVEIRVNQDGDVVSAKAVLRGTTLLDTNIWRLCEQAARKSKFTANPDAPEVQKGKITYIFK